MTPAIGRAARLPGRLREQYDDEMLDAHFIAGDGRVNENIGLTAVHHVFHSEHNRLWRTSGEDRSTNPARPARC